MSEINENSILSCLYRYYRDEIIMEQFLKKKLLPIWNFGRPKNRNSYGNLKAALNNNVLETGAGWNYRLNALAISSLFNIPLSEFGLKDDDPFVNQINSSRGELVSMYQLKPIVKESKQRNKELREHMERYIEASKHFLSHIKENIYIYDYLGRFEAETGIESKERYQQAHNEMFLRIEEELRDAKNMGKRIKYARFLTLSHADSTKLKKGKNKAMDKTLLALFITLKCPIELFGHIVRTLFEFPEYNAEDLAEDTEKDRRGVINYGFYLMNQPTRAYHYAIINEGNYILTEYLRFNKNQVYQPDLLFTESNRINHNLYRVYLNEIESLINGHLPKLTIAVLTRVFVLEYEEDMQLSKEEIDDIKRKEEIFYNNLKKSISVDLHTRP